MPEEKVNIDNLVGKEKISLCQEVVNGHSYKKIFFKLNDGRKKTQTLDVVSANAILSVYNALSEKSRENFIAKHFLIMLDISWKLLAKTGA